MKINLLIIITIFTLLFGGFLKDSQAAEKSKSSKITKANGGYTIEEVFSKKGNLSGKKISVRGKVVKFNSAIMGKNWLHLNDGSGKQGTDDLTVTTSQDAHVGDVVLVNGVIAIDKDFGGGYKYEVIMEESSVTVEK